MMTTLFLSMMISTIIFIITMILNLMSKKALNDREKMSPFECGFDPKNLGRLPFSLQFFLITVIFVIFDIELTLLLPLILVAKISNWINYSLTLNLFIIILLIGLFHEQNQGSLNWVK
uniref:NADH-ubiquinone oxidoreductase chain 3 n=1 Tax=Coccotorus chaoi TaxID=2978103 RepID=A0A977JP82_9CUCU